MAAPYRPSERERCQYFYGQTGNPPLVARTSIDRWTQPVHLKEDMGLVHIPKKWVALPPEVYQSQWTSDVHSAIELTLSSCSWTSFLPVRVGVYHPVHESGRYLFSTILLVAVEPGSLRWEDGLAIALQCREVLTYFGILGVEVEICESSDLSIPPS
ncbi:hypothetical protein F4802DRAFT_589459 [Xylaria palmicola]|nr:hypothetical protein F4802DRAFT_589459 [Xylaria palmicola]